MKGYHACWGIATSLLGFAGGVLALLNLPPRMVLVNAAGVAIACSASWVMVGELVPRPADWPRPGPAAAVAFAAAVAAMGLSLLVGRSQAALLLVLVVLSSPAATRGYGALLRGCRRRSLSAAWLTPRPWTTEAASPSAMAASAPLDLAVAVQQLSDEELASAWRLSCQGPPLSAGPDQRLGWMVMRQVYLDEFQRRSPAAFAVWLAESARTDEPGSRHFPSSQTDAG